MYPHTHMYFFANWKMYLTASEESVLLGQIKSTMTVPQQVSLAIFPTMLSMSQAVNTYAGTRVGIGAQNVSWVPRGAYTGTISAEQVADLGVQYSLVGHSERRYIFSETNAAVRKKIEACFDSKIIPVLCVGETPEDRAEEKREYRLKKQLTKAFDGVEVPAGVPLFIAYEPVWAIGTGEACNPEEAESVAMWIRQQVQAMHPEAEINILYGGSVRPENVVSYTTLANVDGVLVGGASAKYDSLIAMIEQLSK